MNLKALFSGTKLTKPGIGLALVLAFVCVFRFPVDDLRSELNMLAIVAGILGLVVLLWHENRWWALFLVLTLCSTFYPFYSRHSYHALWFVAMGCVWFYAVTKYGERDLILDAICFAALLNCIWVFLQVSDLDPLFRPVDGWARFPRAALMGNENLSSGFLAMSAPAFFREKRWLGLLPLGAALLWIPSCGGIVALCSGAAFYQVARGKWKISLAVTVLVVGLYILLIDRPGMERLPVYKKVLSMWTQHPITGSGIGHWKVVSQQIKPDMPFGTWWRTCHNDLLQMLFEMGAISFLLFAGYVRGIGKRLWRWRKFRGTPLTLATAFIIILVQSTVSFPFHVGPTAILAVTWLALINKLPRSKSERWI